ncbi:hypothetical protein [Caulobacter sp. NIBR2454]|uniref:hypothetical protein n=1 Tax=Caulobacter sp. NIBR2454 TaxID=3015996 RepID=UPI0022B74B3C|nr:hypothetical protein [Caulobacter sp. NIBR2454]
MNEAAELRASAEHSRQRASTMPVGPARGVLEVMAREHDRDADIIEREGPTWMGRERRHLDD